MKPTNPPTPRTTWLLRGLAAACAALAVLASGCGGGVGVGGTGSFASGPISGFGSIFVNGIEFELDDRTAEVLDDSGGRRTSDALRLGMLVEVESGPIGGTSAAPTATATRVRFASDVIGPVDAVDTTLGTLSVLGQTVVVVDGRTAFDASFTNGLASVVEGSKVEVFGFFGPNGRLVATRIQPRGDTLASYKLRGVVGALDSTARTLQIGDALLDYTGVTPPAGLQVGRVVRVTVATTAVGERWRVLTLEDGLRRLPDGDDTRLRGTVTSRQSSRSFTVNGQPVDASGASIDNEAGIVPGARVEVEGTARNGTLVATRVKVDDGSGAEEGRLIGLIESRPVAQTFVLRGVRVLYTQETRFDNGTAADLAIGRDVEARGVLSPDGTKLLATRITFR